VPIDIALVNTADTPPSQRITMEAGRLTRLGVPDVTDKTVAKALR
jgi:hypothetical protein